VKAAVVTVAVAVAVAAVVAKAAASVDKPSQLIIYVAGQPFFGDLRHFSYFCAFVIDVLP
jgi:hypothetical protein